ncbi:DUF2851 family protein [Elizabethkingia meningoseptica]
MNEKLLQYIWYYRKFSDPIFSTSDHETIEIIDFGVWNMNAGPDFLFAKIKMTGMILTGNIELHVKSSDWILHGHSDDNAYNNVILHVVLIHDIDIPELKEKNIPTLVLKDYIDESLVEKYATMMEEQNFIPCEQVFDLSKIPLMYEEESVLQKLELKAQVYQKILEQNKNNFEALLFQQLAFAFGLKVNSKIFHQLASVIDFNIVNKIRQHQVQLEALFYGLCGWLGRPKDDNMRLWRREFDFLQSKFRLPELRLSPVFSKLRPASFPTIRLSQFANLYAGQQNLFSVLIQNPDYQNTRNILSSVTSSDYWYHHYTFGKATEITSEKRLSAAFIDLLFINCILPLQYFFHRQDSEYSADIVIEAYRQLAPEKNHIIKQWEDMGVKFHNGLQTQAFLHQYKTFCKAKKCLNCAIGFQLLKNAEQP